MIVKSFDFEKNIDSFCRNNFFLFYGENTGKVLDLTNHLTKKIKFFDSSFNSVLNFDQNDIEANNNILKQNLICDDLFGGKKILRFNLLNTTAFNKVFAHVNLEKVIATKIIIKCNELEKRNSLRNEFEKNKSLIVIPCYRDSIYEKNFILNKMLKNELLDLTSEQKKLISEIDYKDRNMFKQNINKAIIFLKGSPNITTESFKKILNIQDLHEVNKFVSSVLSNKDFDMETQFNNIIRQGTTSISIINRLSYHVQRLLLTKHRTQAGEDIKIAIKKLKPPIFFKEENDFISQVNRWSTQSLENLIINLLYLEDLLKKSSLNEITETKFLCLHLKKYSESLSN